LKKGVGDGGTSERTGVCCRLKRGEKKKKDERDL